MSKRNLIWILAVFLLMVLFWQMPDTVSRHRSFYKVFAPLVDIRATIHKNYVEEISDDELLEGAIQGMLQQLDPFSRYIPPEQQKDFDQQTTGVIHGIGILVDQRKGQLIVISPLEDSPAFHAGILPGDVILTIAGKTTQSMSITDAIKMLKGEPKTSVDMEVRHEFTGKIEKLSVERGLVRIPSIKGYVRDEEGSWNYLIDKENRIGYIRLTNFLDSTHEELDAAITTLDPKTLGGLILDFRFNPGGLLKSAVRVANRFLTSGVIVSTKGRFHREITYSAEGYPTYPPMPVVILVNQYTASAAEIVSGALKDHKRATVVGVRTFGKGSVQNVIELQEGYGYIKITTAYYYLPSGRNIHRGRKAAEWGVDPDVEITLTGDEMMAVERSRREADILYAPASTNASTKQATTTTTTRAGTPKPLMIDRQLGEALKILRGKVARTQVSAAASAK